MGGAVSNVVEDSPTSLRGDVYGKFFDDIQSGNLKGVQIAVQYTEINVNKTDSKGRPAIYAAAEYNQLAIVQYLTSVEGIDVNAVAKEGNVPVTPVCIAADKGHRDIVDFLLLHGANPLDAHTMFRYGASIGDLAIVKQAVEKHVDINQEKSGETALYMAAKGGHYEVVDYLAGLEGIELNQWSPGSDTARKPIAQAAFHGHDAVVTCLLKHGAAPLNPVLELLFASKNGNLTVVQKALQESTNKTELMNATDERNNTAVYWATINGHIPIIEYLSSMGAQVTSNHLVAAAEEGQIAVVEYLLKHHDVNVHHVDNKSNDNALSLACRRGIFSPP